MIKIISKIRKSEIINKLATEKDCVILVNTETNATQYPASDTFVVEDMNVFDEGDVLALYKFIYGRIFKKLNNTFFIWTPFDNASISPLLNVIEKLENQWFGITVYVLFSGD